MSMIYPPYNEKTSGGLSYIAINSPKYYAINIGDFFARSHDRCLANLRDL